MPLSELTQAVARSLQSWEAGQLNDTFSSHPALWLAKA
jgi:hypothetical protein